LNGTALYSGVVALLVAEVYGLDLTLAQQVTIILTASVAAFGMGRSPAVIILSTFFFTTGLPLEGAGLIAGIDVIIDMARASLNVIGDQCVAVVVANSEGLLYSEVQEQKQ
jgi:Na+/H+-dicarboxylate symporter